MVWAVGASVLLHHYGLIENPDDIDILVDLKDIERVDEILKNIGEKKDREKSDTYLTKHFYEYVVRGIDIDVMAGLRISHNNGIFEYIFDNTSILECRKINGVNIPLSSLEDWYVLYQLIPGREIKVKMIENYLLLNGVKNPAFLDRALRGDVPREVRDRIQGILKA